MRLIEARSSEIIEKWKEYFGEIFFYWYFIDKFGSGKAQLLGVKILG